ncbi:uncharacterized protein [Blastocystis hominis]|uniref:Uncharacterized protein n=1 Tax=Blastocystis hominis TaxID=12968 RepID=D8LX49_BLAHO|nr:uncharacterized protein [Blastocystis hominis]CBK20844.2 unnamed protein product [Blastocystis hominis]|eukprot:XP_012894892.1 uncharacterized protein [Blastocystis hominis]
MSGVYVEYKGLDTSFNPGLSSTSSLVNALEQYNSHRNYKKFRFGDSGSLMLVRRLTSIAQTMQVKRVGYCGMMLPVLEDCVLAERWTERRLNSTMLMALSAVCGVGIDTMPLPNTAYAKPMLIQAIIEDVIALASKWDKPLSCRIFIAPDTEDCGLTKFASPHLCNCRVYDFWGVCFIRCLFGT